VDTDRYRYRVVGDKVAVLYPVNRDPDE